MIDDFSGLKSCSAMSSSLSFSCLDEDDGFELDDALLLGLTCFLAVKRFFLSLSCPSLAESNSVPEPILGLITFWLRLCSSEGFVDVIFGSSVLILAVSEPCSR